MSGGRSDGGTVVEERREEIIREGPRYGQGEFFEKTTFERRGLSPPRNPFGHGRSRSVGPAPVIVDAHAPVEVIERSNHIPVGPLVLVGDRRSKDDRAIRAEIRALEAEREALKAEQKAQIEFERADRFRRGDLVVYEEIVRREREPDGVVEIKRDKKGRMSIIVPRR
jgi:methionine aminopeptidase